MMTPSSVFESLADLKEIVRRRKRNVILRIAIKDPKSGKGHEIVFIPKRVAERLKEYAHSFWKNSYDRIFPVSYEAERVIVAKAGKVYE